MMVSKFYKQLIAVERKLQKVFISAKVFKNPNTENSQYRIQSYRLMCHAEIEYYIETISLEKVKIEKTKFDATRTVSTCLACILAYTNTSFPGVSSRLSEISSKNDFVFRINFAISNYEKSIKSNNGLKETDVIPIWTALGIDYTKINQTLLNNLSSFGKIRGDTAHSSVKVKSLINPSDEINAVRQILLDLKTIDSLVFEI